MRVVPFTDAYLDAVFEIQQQAYLPLFQKYHDSVNPYLESKDTVLRKYTRPGTCGYVFLEQGRPVGAVRIVCKDDVCKVSALAVLPEYQNRGIAQKALRKIEKLHSHAKTWVLDTLMQEPGNCHLYEKLGYTQTGNSQIVNEQLTLVFYQKTVH